MTRMNKSDKSCLDSLPFQSLMALAIVFNSAIVGLETDFPGLRCWTLLENVLLVIFVTELVMRIALRGCRKYFNLKGPDIAWNVFDFIVVTL